jgi:two-component system response regulator HydG
VFVIDDQAAVRHALGEMLQVFGYHVRTFESADAFLAALAGDETGCIVADVRMPGIDGIELMTRAMALDASLSVVVMTAFGNVRDAVLAMRAGAAHYITKPVDVDELSLVIERTLKQRALAREANLLRDRVRVTHRFENLLGVSSAMQSLFKTIAQVAPSRATVLLTGESGTGKERVAQAIHESSNRREGPFVKLHCAALAESLLESELFGHEKGAFTGANTRREGRFKLAHGGTLFLDEISEISPAIQVKLLRVLQERAFERVGGNETLKVDVRILAATNRDLTQLVREGRFREDLFYRLNVVSLRLPPLRERREDIPQLAEHFLQRFVSEAGRTIKGFTPEARAALVAYSWPGNVRELENAVERAVVLNAGPQVSVEHLSLSTSNAAPIVASTPETTTPEPVTSLGSAPTIPGSTLADIERFAIISTLERCGGSTHRTAAMLDVSVRMIQYRLREYRHGIKRMPNSREDGYDSNARSS